MVSERRGRVVAVFFCKCNANFRSFSAVSAPIFASKYAFCRIFQHLPDYVAVEFWQKIANDIVATFAIIF